jgi:small redox-active disulfide protein 2
VFGPGCAKCNKTEEIIREVVAEFGMDVTIHKITDITEIAKQGVFGTPAVVIDGDVKCVGKVPKKEEMKNWLDQ